MFRWRTRAVVLLTAAILSSQSAVAAGVHTLQPRPGAAHTIPHYTFDVDLDYAEHRLDAIEQIMLPNSFGAALSELVFNVPPAHAPDLFYLHDIRVNDEPAAFDFVGTTMTITLPSKLWPNDVVTVTFDFALRVPPLDDKVTSFAAANLAYTGDAMTVGYWYPMLAPYRPGYGWIQVPWHPIGDPFASESADYSVTITATPGAQVIAGGEMSHEKDAWHFDLPRGRTFAFIVGPHYWRMDAAMAGTTYSLYTFGEHTLLAPVAIQTVIQSASLFAALYGPYPYSALRVVEVNGPWSMEFSGMVTLGAGEFADYDGTNRNRLIRIAAHEVSHQWWYGVVGNDQAHEPWLDEGFARFNELRYYEFYSPRDADWWRATIFRGGLVGTVDSPIYAFGSHPAYLDRVYNQGALFLDALRARIGEQAFNAFLRDLYRYGSFRLITADDFFAVLSRHTRLDMRPLTRRFFSSR